MFEIFLTISILWGGLGFLIFFIKSREPSSLITGLFTFSFYMGPIGVVFYFIVIFLAVVLVVLERNK